FSAGASRGDHDCGGVKDHGVFADGDTREDESVRYDFLRLVVLVKRDRRITQVGLWVRRSRRRVPVIVGRVADTFANFAGASTGCFHEARPGAGKNGIGAAVPFGPVVSEAVNLCIKVIVGGIDVRIASSVVLPDPGAAVDGHETAGIVLG